METLRDKLIHHGASVQFVSRICSLRLNASFHYQSELDEVLANLRYEVYIQLVRNHKVLRQFQN